MPKPPWPITARQQMVYDFIRTRSLADGVPPTFRQMCAHIGSSNTNGVRPHVAALVRKGYLREVDLHRSGGSNKTSGKRPMSYVLANPEIEIGREGDRIRLALTSPKTFTPDEWRAWLAEQLAATSA